MRQIFGPIGVAAVAFVAFCGVSATPANAQGYVMMGKTPSQGNCSVIRWEVLPSKAAGGGLTIAGVSYFADMSGISTIKGTISKDGTINATVTSVSGNGPAGDVTGKRTAKGTSFQLKGTTPCSNAKVAMHPVPEASGGGGGG